MWYQWSSSNKISVKEHQQTPGECDLFEVFLELVIPLLILEMLPSIYWRYIDIFLTGARSSAKLGSGGPHLETTKMAKSLKLSRTSYVKYFCSEFV